MLEVTAPTTAFEPTCLVAPAEEEFTLTFNNEDEGVTHNLAILTEADEEVAATDLKPGTYTDELPVSPQEEGDLQFLCQAHPDVDVRHPGDRGGGRRRERWRRWRKRRWRRRRLAAPRSQPGHPTALRWVGELHQAGIVHHPGRSRRLPLPRRGRQGRLRREGRLAPEAAGELLVPTAPSADRGHGGRGGERRVDRRFRRGRRVDAGVQPDPAVPAALQHPLPRRQVVSLPRAHGGGDVAARPGPPRDQAEEGPVLRAVRARLGDPGHAGRPDARVPHPHLHEPLLRPARPRRAALPLLRHRPVLRPLRPDHHRDHGGGVPERRRRARGLPRGELEAGAPAPRRGDGRGVGSGGVRAGGAIPRPAAGGAPGAGEPGDGPRPAREPGRRRPRRGRPRGRLPGLHGSRRTGPRPEGMDRRSRGGPRPRPSSSRRSSGSSTWSAKRCRRGSWCRRSRRTGTCWRPGSRPVAVPTSRSPCRRAAPSVA